jgi:hypothetical protein
VSPHGDQMDVAATSCAAIPLSLGTTGEDVADDEPPKHPPASRANNTEQSVRIAVIASLDVRRPAKFQVKQRSVISESRRRTSGRRPLAHPPGHYAPFGY